MLVIRMDNIFIKNKKFHANIPIFQRKKKVESHEELCAKEATNRRPGEVRKKFEGSYKRYWST